MIERTPLVQLSHTEIRALPKARVSCCYLGKAIRFRKERNAYWGSDSVESPPGSYFLSRDEAKAAVELLRVRGTHFQITEIPALVLFTECTHVLIVDGRRKPFRQHGLESVSGVTLSEVVQSIVRHNIYANVLRSHSFVPLPKLPFLQYESYSRGKAFDLGWKSYHAELDLSHALEAVREICTLANQPAA